MVTGQAALSGICSASHERPFAAIPISQHLHIVPVVFTLPEFVPLTSRQRHKFGRCCSAEASMYHEWTGTRQT